MATYIQYIHTQTKATLTATPERWAELEGLKNIHGEPLYTFLLQFEKEESKPAEQAKATNARQPRASVRKCCGKK